MDRSEGEEEDSSYEEWIDQNAGASTSSDLPCLCFRWLAMLGTVGLLMSIITFIVMSGVAYGYFKNDSMRWGPPVNMKVMFGCGIGVGMLLLIVIWSFFHFPLFFVHYILTFPIFISMSCLYIVYTQPVQIEKCLAAWDMVWDASLFLTQFQIENKCCGWWNASDRGISNCHMEYYSGCRDVLKNYLEPRLAELNRSGIFILCLSVISIVFVVGGTCALGGHSVFYLF